MTTTYKSNGAVTTLGAAIVALALVMPISILAGLWVAFVATVLWGWFVTPQFGLAVPGIWVMFGLLVLLRLPTMKPSDDDKPGVDWDKVLRATIFSVIAPAMALLSGWIATLFM